MHAKDFVQSYIDAWNRHDAGHVAEHLAPEGIYVDVPEQEHRPRHELFEYLAEFFDHDQNHYSINGDITSSKNTIAFQYKVVHVNGSEEEEVFHGAEFVTLEGDKAIHIADYYREPRLGGGQKYAKSGLSEDLLERYKSKLTHLMSEEQAYMNPSLTLPKLSNMVQCPVNHLSQVINAGFGVSFFDYLNEYRIEEAKRILSDQSDRPQPILSVAFEVGFNSNSAFYSAFKRLCGQTPAQFRKKQLADHV